MNSLPIRKNIHLTGYDYSSNGYYFITVCAKDRRLYNENQDTIKEVLHSLPGRFSGLSLDYSVIMDDHVHAIMVLEGSEKTMGEIIRQFKALVTVKTNLKGIWQKGYYEHIIRNEQALHKIREYIHNNPLVARLEFEQFY